MNHPTKEVNDTAAETSGKNSSDPAWMEDELVKSIDKRKLEFLSQLFHEGHGRSQKELMAYLMPMLRKAKQEHLAFTQQEINAAISAIRKHSSADELIQIDKILAQAANPVASKKPSH